MCITSWWEFLAAINEEEHAEERLLRMPVCVVLASLESCNVVVQNELLFGRQAKTGLCYITCGVRRQYGDFIEVDSVCVGSYFKAKYSLLV